MKNCRSVAKTACHHPYSLYSVYIYIFIYIYIICCACGPQLHQDDMMTSVIPTIPTDSSPLSVFTPVVPGTRFIQLWGVRGGSVSRFGSRISRFQGWWVECHGCVMWFHMISMLKVFPSTVMTAFCWISDRLLLETCFVSKAFLRHRSLSFGGGENWETQDDMQCNLR